MNKKNIKNLDEETLRTILNNYEIRQKAQKTSKTRTEEHKLLYPEKIYEKHNKNYNNINKLKLIEKFNLIARKPDFKEEDVFGQNVQTNKELANYARHLLPQRNVYVLIVRH